MTADASTLAFFQALQLAFDATLSRYARQPTLLDAVLAQAVDSFEGNVAIQCADESPLACERGCAACCTLRVVATAPEVLAVARFLRRLEPALLARGIDLIAILRRAHQHTHALTQEQRVRLRQRCPFVAQGVCVIYPVRPLACRGHASHDAKACADAAASRRLNVPYSEGHHQVRALVQNAMQASLRRAGLAWGLYELNAAVVAALDQGDGTVHTWLYGGDPLGACAVPDMPAGEMAVVFDQLRPI